MKSYILKTDGKKVEVKNLGWLLKHWREVSGFSFQYAPNNANMVDGQLCAFLGNDWGSNNDRYFTDFASLFVLWNWLDRPVFQGINFNLVNEDNTINKNFMIGSAEWKYLNKLDSYEEFFVKLGLKA